MTHERSDNLVDRMRLLTERLKEWARYYENADTDPKPDEARRHAWRQQMQEIVSELRRCGIPGHLFRPMIAGIHAVGDLDEGRKSPLLQPRKKPGGQQPLSQLSIQRGVASAAVTLLIDDGVSEPCALKKVAVRIARWPAVVNRRRRTKNGKQQTLEDALQDWREKAKSGGASPDSVFYNTNLALYEEAQRRGRSRADFANSILIGCEKLFR